MLKEILISQSFYRFVNQTRDPHEALNCDDKSHVDHRDLQPEMYVSEPRENVEFDNFYDSAKQSKKLKKVLRTFEYVYEKILFSALFYLGC